MPLSILSSPVFLSRYCNSHTGFGGSIFRPRNFHKFLKFFVRESCWVAASFLTINIFKYLVHISMEGNSRRLGPKIMVKVLSSYLSVCISTCLSIYLSLFLCMYASMYLSKPKDCVATVEQI